MIIDTVARAAYRTCRFLLIVAVALSTRYQLWTCLVGCHSWHEKLGGGLICWIWNEYSLTTLFVTSGVLGMEFK